MMGKTQSGTIDRRLQLHNIIAEELELEPNELTDTGHFIEDYDADSLTLITVASRIEQELGVSVPDREWSKIINMAVLYEMIDRYAAPGSEHA